MSSFDIKPTVTVSVVGKWLTAVQNLITPTRDGVILEAVWGKKYIKIIETYQGHTRSVFAFIDKVSGDILKAASWAAPAKHARGNLFDEFYGLKYITPYGPEYLQAGRKGNRL